MSKRCIIVGAGEFYGCPKPEGDDLVIAADGGYAELKKRNITPSLLIGDLDSLGFLPSGIEFISFPKEKDDTDMRLAYLEGKRRGYTDFEIYGGVGGRSDHTFANYCLLYEICKNGGSARLIGRNEESFVIAKECYTGAGEAGKTVSVFAFSDKACGVTIKGLKYEAFDLTLDKSFPLGVSNETVGSDFLISVRDGALLIIREI
jgi:thiamine pyrophosphokinase